MDNRIPGEFYTWLASQPGYEEITPEEAKVSFQGWSREIRGAVYLRYLQRAPEAMPRGRPQPDKYGINENDWLVLSMLGGNSQKVLAELNRWYEAGYINEFQHRDIWGELNNRLTQAQTTLLATGYTEEEWPVEYQRRLVAQERLKEEKEQGRLAYAGRHGMLFDRTPTPAKPFTEYGAGLEGMRTGFAGEVPQTERWQDWFRSRYPRMIEQFEAKPEAERIGEKTWTEYLKKKKPEIKEEYYKMSPYERGERPSAYQPRIQTVKFT